MTLVHTTGVICVELVRKLQDAGARFTESGSTTTGGARHVGVLPGRSDRPHLRDLAALSVQLVVLRRGRTSPVST